MTVKQHPHIYYLAATIYSGIVILYMSLSSDVVDSNFHSKDTRLRKLVTLHEIHSQHIQYKTKLSCIPSTFIYIQEQKIIFKKWFTAIISNCSAQKASRTAQFRTYFQPSLLGECCWKGDWPVAADGHGWNELSRFIPVGLDMALRQFLPPLWLISGRVVVHPFCPSLIS